MTHQNTFFARTRRSFTSKKQLLYLVQHCLGFDCPKILKSGDAGMINRFGATRIGVWVIKHVISPFQRWIFQTTGGRFLSNVGLGREVLLLTTKGRRTGKDRTVPVFYLRDGEDIVICNVTPEFEKTNPWVINLRSDPIAQIQIGSDTARYHAREATSEEINSLWPQLVKLWPAYKVLFERGGRRTIFMLQRASFNQTDAEKRFFEEAVAKTPNSNRFPTSGAHQS